MPTGMASIRVGRSTNDARFGPREPLQHMAWFLASAMVGKSEQVQVQLCS